MNTADRISQFLPQNVCPPPFFEPSIVLNSPPRHSFLAEHKPLPIDFDTLSLKRSFDGNFKASHERDLSLPKPVNLMPIIGRRQSLLNPDPVEYVLAQPRHHHSYGQETDFHDEAYASQATSFASRTSSNSADGFEILLSTLWSDLPLDQLLELCFRKELPRPMTITEPIAANDSDLSSLEVCPCKDCKDRSKTGDGEAKCRKCDGKGWFTKTQKHSKANMERRAWHKFFLLWLHRLVPDELLKECGFSYVTRTGATQGPTKDVLLKASVLHIQKLIDIIHLLRDKDYTLERAAEHMQQDLARRDVTIFELQQRLREKDEAIISLQKEMKQKDLYHDLVSSAALRNNPVQSCGVKRPASVDEGRTNLSSPKRLSTPTAPTQSQAFKWKPNVTIVQQRKKRRRTTRAGEAEMSFDGGTSA